LGDADSLAPSRGRIRSEIEEQSSCDLPLPIGGGKTSAGESRRITLSLQCMHSLQAHCRQSIMAKD